MKKILLIEDETNIRAMYAEVLREDKFEVIEVAEGMSGWRVAQEKDWDLLLLDIMLPTMDGIELLRKIKGREDLKLKPVVVVSNLGDENVKKTCMELGAKDFLVKSDIKPEDVLLTVKKYVSNKKEQASDLVVQTDYV
ncbi:response regulator transcription factor [Patescibacteria group bacterium]